MTKVSTQATPKETHSGAVEGVNDDGDHLMGADLPGVEPSSRVTWRRRWHNLQYVFVAQAPGTWSEKRAKKAWEDDDEKKAKHDNANNEKRMQHDTNIDDI